MERLRTRLGYSTSPWSGRRSGSSCTDIAVSTVTSKRSFLKTRTKRQLGSWSRLRSNPNSAQDFCPLEQLYPDRVLNRQLSLLAPILNLWPGISHFRIRTTFQVLENRPSLAAIESCGAAGLARTVSRWLTQSSTCLARAFSLTKSRARQNNCSNTSTNNHFKHCCFSRGQIHQLRKHESLISCRDRRGARSTCHAEALAPASLKHFSDLSQP